MFTVFCFQGISGNGVQISMTNEISSWTHFKKFMW